MIRTFPGWLHVCYFLAGFFTFGAAWVLWWLHALLFYLLITRRDRQRVCRVVEEIVLAVIVAELIENADEVACGPPSTVASA